MIKARHLKRYVREPDHGVELGQATNIIIVSVIILIESRLAINYILGGPFND